MYRTPACLLAIIAAFSCSEANAQDLEPRRWTILPVGTNIIGAGYGRLNGDVLFNPLLEIEDATVEGHAVVTSYVRSFAVGSKTGRLDVTVPWANMRWSGLLQGEPATASRVGLSDPRLRLSVILMGDRPDKTAKSNTIIGAALALTVPAGKYLEDRLLNLGTNRYTLRPQFGVLHYRGKWSFELTGSVFLFSDNDDFFGGSTLEQDPLYAAQSHLIYNFDNPRYWAALSAGYGWDGQSTRDGVEVDDSRRLFLSALSVGMPAGRRQSVSFRYIRTRTNTDRGADIDTFSVGWSYVF